MSDHHIVPSGYMNDRSGSIVFRCHSQKKNTSTSNHHTTSDSRGFSQKRNKNIKSEKLRVQELSLISIKQKNVLITHIRKNRSRFGDEWLVRVERSQFKRYDTRRFLFFYLIDCFPLEKDDRDAYACLESQPVAHDCA